MNTLYTSRKALTSTGLQLELVSEQTASPQKTAESRCQLLTKSFSSSHIHPDATRYRRPPVIRTGQRGRTRLCERGVSHQSGLEGPGSWGVVNSERLGIQLFFCRVGRMDVNPRS